MALVYRVSAWSYLDDVGLGRSLHVEERGECHSVGELLGWISGVSLRGGWRHFAVETVEREVSGIGYRECSLGVLV